MVRRAHDGRGRADGDGELGDYQMNKRKFVRGAYTLAADITDLDAYYQEHKTTIDEIIKWADQIGMYVGFGTSSDNTYLCEYENHTANKVYVYRHCQRIKSKIKSRMEIFCSAWVSGIWRQIIRRR